VTELKGGIISAHHGAFDYAELQRLNLSPDEVVDFSVNSNPYGPPICVHEAIMAVPLERYPDRECLELRHQLAQLHAVPMDQIVVGNGTAELLQLIAFAFLTGQSRAVVPAVTFSEYARVVSVMGASAGVWDLADPATLADADLAFLCNPNNPDGTWVSLAQIQAWADRYPQTLFVIDEAYNNFMQEPQTLIGTPQDNILVVRSMTKDYALAGLRLGYVVGAPERIEAIRQRRPAWNVNALAQAAGVAVLHSGAWLAETTAQLHRDKAELIAGLRELGFAPCESQTHYFLMRVGDGAAFRAALLRHKVMVRDCASFGMPDYVRISTRTPQDNARLLAAIQTIQAV
jgi:L-threonine-O-3-phosphate decarboxylase